ncbi:MAG TPA: antibiotic biosynthesis monooxygenase [Acidimicrobiales bacterium]
MDSPGQRRLSEAYGLVVRFTIRPGCERQFDDLVATTVAAIRQHEPGTLLYGVHTVEGEPRQRVFYELYRDRAAFEDHEEQPHVRYFLAERDRLLERVEVVRLTPTVYVGLTEPTP